MKKYIISVLGKDRPGIIASVAKLLYREDFNVEDVSQTILQAEFSGSFIVSGPDKSNAKDLREALRKETDDDSLFFHVRQLESQAQRWSTTACEPFVITTSGVTSPPALRHALDVLGPDLILFAADYPYESVEEAVNFMDTAPISDGDRRKIYQTNAEKLFKLL